MEHWKNKSKMDIDGEVWEYIPGYKEMYMASSFGRIKSIGSVENRIYTKIMSQIVEKIGYLNVRLRINGKYTLKRVHRLIGITFIPNPENKRQINHIKGVKSDNRVSELEWATPKEDSQHAYRTGLLKLPPTTFYRGADNPNSIPVNQYDLDGNFIKTFPSGTIALEEIGVSSGINEVCNGKRKIAGGFQWRFFDDNSPVKKVLKYGAGRTHHMAKPVYQCDHNGVILKEWDNARQASIATKILVQSIGKACLGKIKTAGGYKWRFV